MAIAKELDVVDQRFMQQCPFCARYNRMVMHGLFVIGNKVEKHPDMGYSFCNCSSVFYTDRRNIIDPCEMMIGKDGIITYPDPFFAWPNPYDFLHWNVRHYQVLYDMDSVVDDIRNKGYTIEYARRDFDVNSKTPQHFHIKVLK